MAADTDPPNQPLDARSTAVRKAALRQWALEQRNAQEVEIATTSATIQLSLEPFLAALRTGWVVLFDPMPGEIDLSGLIEALPRRDFALTRTPTTGRTLTLHPASAPRERHRFGYTQPVAGAPIIPDADVCVVLVPGLVFDQRGGRLGFGAGYYDRFLSRFAADVALVGVSSLPLVDAVPTEAHDVKMTHVASPQGLRSV